MPVPKSMQVQLARLFGTSSAELKSVERTPRQWRKTLQKQLDEVFKYAEENINTDEVHWLMICSGFADASESLKAEEFWPGYVEGITRVCLLLMGDYPDHRKYKGGKRKANHYDLGSYRKLVYAQGVTEKEKVVRIAAKLGVPGVALNIREVVSEFRSERGWGADSAEFVSWFKKRYPKEYASIF